MQRSTQHPRRRAWLRRLIVVAVLAAAVGALLSQTVFAQTSYIITDGDRVTVHRSYSSDPYEVLTEAGIELEEEDTYETGYADGMNQITVRRMQMVTVINRGAQSVIGTYGETTGSLLARMGITPGTGDTLSCSSETQTYDGMTIELVHTETRIEEEDTTVPYPVNYYEDPDLEPGAEIVLVAGQNGLTHVKSEVTYRNGKEVSRVIVRMILLCLIFATMLVCTLSPGRWLLLLIPAGVVVGAYFLKGLAGGEGYAAGRMDSTWGLAPLDTAGMLWQTRQSIYAISTGGMFGVGIGASVQKHQWLPYAENDFIFGVIGEELGFFGCVILIGAFAVLLIMGIMIALRAPDLYGTVLGIGIISQIAWQVFLHIAVGTALIPNTGISLPFFSSGGTSLLLLLSEMGVLLSISRAGNAREQRLAEQHRAETERMLQRTRYRSRAAR